MLGNSPLSTPAVAKGEGLFPRLSHGNAIVVRDDLVPELRLERLDLAFPERLLKPDWVLEASLSLSQNQSRKRDLLSHVVRSFVGGRWAR